jgi:hypothetical protein
MTDEDTLKHYETMIREANLNAQQVAVGQQQQHIAGENKERGMLEEQLDVNEILDNIHNLLRGYVLKNDPETNRTVWEPPKNEDMIILTDYGVNYIMGAVQWYLNKNTLLSNYDEETIWVKMEDFGITIADNLFMEYDKMFKHPTVQEVKDELSARVKAKVDLKKFTLELLGSKVSEAEEKGIKDKILKELEPRIEKELTVIKEQKMKNKLKRFESIVRFVQDTVHSAYLRAWRGQERTSIRQHIHVAETKGGLTPMGNSNSFNPLSMFKK